MVGPIRRRLARRRENYLWVENDPVYTDVSEIDGLLRDFPRDIRNQIISEMQRFRYLLLVKFNDRYVDGDVSNNYPPDWARQEMSRRLSTRREVSCIDIYKVSKAPLRIQRVYSMSLHDYYHRWKRRTEPIF